jgi:hypothetical protein
MRVGLVTMPLKQIPIKVIKEGWGLEMELTILRLCDKVLKLLMINFKLKLFLD